MPRSAGVLMHITSLPSPWGAGTLGEEAFRFVDFLQAAGQTWWQILPVGPTGYGASPYQSYSAFAGNPYLIDPGLLCQEGLLTPDEPAEVDWGKDAALVDFDKLEQGRMKLLRLAWGRARQNHKIVTAIEAFCQNEKDWLEDYALFMALKGRFGGAPWHEWPDEPLRLHKKKALQACKAQLEEETGFWEFTQFMFFRQWKALKQYANSRGVRLLGDMPIYVAADSADAWSRPELFWLDRQRRPVCVAGCPPDYFSETGQLWGNPLYDWTQLKKTGYAWWVARMKSAAALFDMTRIDHFRGFESYYAVPYGEKTAVNGSWKRGPGMDLFRALRRQAPSPIVAEDLGDITPAVRKLLKKTGYPGMKVLCFAFGSGSGNDYLPHNHIPNCVVYTGTHDNNTIEGWLAEAAPQERAYAVRYCRLNRREGYAWGMIRTAYQSVAQLAIAPMQDILGLGQQARMNVPSTLGGNNWRWRMLPGAATPALAAKLRTLCETYGRCPEPPVKEEEQDD